MTGQFFTGMAIGWALGATVVTVRRVGSLDLDRLARQLREDFRKESAHATHTDSRDGDMEPPGSDEYHTPAHTGRG